MRFSWGDFEYDFLEERPIWSGLLYSVFGKVGPLSLDEKAFVGRI
jgi:hypothetical protein